MKTFPGPSVRSGLHAMVSLALVWLAVNASGRAVAQPPSGMVRVYVGTYTGGESRGIYVFELDPTGLKTTAPRLAVETPSPSFLAIHPTGRTLYAANEIDQYQGEATGSVSAFAVDSRSGALTLLNAQASGGGSPCHLVVDKAGKNVLVANYGGGSAAVLPVSSDGRLGVASSVVRHKGSGPNPARQKEPHAHSVNLDVANAFAIVADLGLDKLLVYRFDPTKGTIAPNAPDAARLAPGAGPRHVAVHPGGRLVYAINELNSTITGFAYDPTRGTLREIETVTTLPKGFAGENYPADVQVHPSGKFLFGSNRGHNSIVVYTIDPGTGKLSHVENETEGIKNPRNFGMEPGGSLMLVANQDLDTVVSFRIDPATGALSPAGQPVKVAKPVCIKFWTPSK